MKSEKIWRWNVDDVWQGFSSMYQEISFIQEATNDIERYHHLTASLLFGGCAVEAFLNTNMRIYCKKKETPEHDVLRRIRYETLRKKLESWPTEICGIIILEQDVKVLLEFLDLRNEVTHRKRFDHSLYKELDETVPNRFLEAIQRTFVQLYYGLGASFPYWLLGWNFVGMNNNGTCPCLNNNQQFKHSLRHMGFNVPASEYGPAIAWEEKNMKGIEAFISLKNNYYMKAPEIEPKNILFPSAPRLCKRWWDKDFILSNSGIEPKKLK